MADPRSTAKDAGHTRSLDGTTWPPRNYLQPSHGPRAAATFSSARAALQPVAGLGHIHVSHVVGPPGHANGCGAETCTAEQGHQLAHHSQSLTNTLWGQGPKLPGRVGCRESGCARMRGSREGRPHWAAQSLAGAATSRSSPLASRNVATTTVSASWLPGGAVPTTRTLIAVRMASGLGFRAPSRGTGSPCPPPTRVLLASGWAPWEECRAGSGGEGLGPDPVEVGPAAPMSAWAMPATTIRTMASVTAMPETAAMARGSSGLVGVRRPRRRAFERPDLRAT